MAMITAQQLAQYYNDYRTTEITFTKIILKTLGLDPRQIYLKIDGVQWPCIINSASFSLARIIIGKNGGAFQQIAKNKDHTINLHMNFRLSTGQLVGFFVSGKVTEIAPYVNSSELVMVTIAFNQRPPEDFIETIGNLIDANQNAIRRKEDRIIINAESCRKMGLIKGETVIAIQGVPRHCILRDVSFGGCKVILMGLAQFLMNKEIILQLEFDEPRERIILRGIILGTQPIDGRKDMVAANIRFDEETVSLAYKIHLNNYLTTTRKEQLDSTTQVQPKQLTASQLQAKADEQAIMDKRAAEQKAAKEQSATGGAQANVANPAAAQNAPASPAQPASAPQANAAPVSPAATQAPAGGLDDLGFLAELPEI